MAASDDTASMALFCDFENIALGVRDAQYEKFDIRPVLERLLAKGSIVVKKAYCDWERYKAFKSGMHEANFELIEIPHVRQSGKNSADIRLVVDALDLCYTKSHVDTFVIISGDSDFSPLVSKLRENAKRVIGVGVKQSCSDLLIANCDEFIYYDDLVRERNGARRESREAAQRRTAEDDANRGEKMEARKTKAVELAAATFADLIADRGDSERVWASVLKEVIKRRNPGFNETYFGFRTFGNLLDEAAGRGLLTVGRDEKSGTFVTRAAPGVMEPESAPAQAALPTADVVIVETTAGELPAVGEEKFSARRRGGRRARKDSPERPPAESVEVAEHAPTPAAEALPVAAEQTGAEEKPRRGGRRPRKAGGAVEAGETAVAESPVSAPGADEKNARRPARGRKAKVGEGGAG